MGERGFGIFSLDFWFSFSLTPTHGHIRGAFKNIATGETSWAIASRHFFLFLVISFCFTSFLFVSRHFFLFHIISFCFTSFLFASHHFFILSFCLHFLSFCLWHSRPLPGDANNDIDDGLPELVGWKCAMTICVF